MSEPFIGEVRAFGFPFAPRGWALCNGQTLAIGQNQALFAVLGTTYGGDGITTFKLPNLQGATPLHQGQGIALGQAAGTASVTLNARQIPHGHLAMAGASADQSFPAGNFPGNAQGQSQYGNKPNTTLNAATVSPAGGGQPHNNVQPSIVINYAIALVGIFPSRN